jgi:hypothetical protein
MLEPTAPSGERAGGLSDLTAKASRSLTRQAVIRGLVRPYPRAVCGRYTNTAGVAELNDRFNFPIDSDVGTRRFNIAPTEEVLAIVAPRGEPEARLLR